MLTFYNSNLTFMLTFNDIKSYFHMLTFYNSNLTFMLTFTDINLTSIF